MKRKITSIMLLSALLATGTCTFTSCKDYDSDAIESLNGQFSDLNSVVKGQIDQLGLTAQELNRINSELNKAIGGKADTTWVRDVETMAKNAKTAADSAQSAADRANQRLDALNNDYDFGGMKDSITSYNTRLIELNSYLNKELGNVKGQIGSLSDKIKNDSIALATLDNKIFGENGLNSRLESLERTVNNRILLWGDSLKTAYNNAALALALAKSDSARIDAANGRIDGVNGRVDSLGNVVNNLNTTVSGLSVTLKHYADSVADAAAKKVEAQLKNYATKLELDSVANAYKNADRALQSQIDSLKNVTYTLNSKIGYINENLAKMVTGVVIQGVTSPVVGSVNLPFDISSNILAAYYGQELNYDLKFPFNASEDVAAARSQFVFPEEAKDFKPLIAAETVWHKGTPINEGKAGNAGNLYVTINPTDVDFNGLNVELVSTSGKAAKGFANVMLKDCDKDLTFGVTRSAAHNGFYEGAVTMNNINEAKINVDAAKVKATAKEVLKSLKPSANGQRRALADAAKTFYDLYSDNRLTAYGVKASWEETKADGSKHNRCYMGEAKLAATAIRPLSYGFLADGTKYKIDYRIPSIQKWLDLKEFTWTPIEGVVPSDTMWVKFDVPNQETVTINGIPAPKVDLDLKKDEHGFVNDATVKVGDLDFSKAKISWNTKKDSIHVVVDYGQFNRVISDMNTRVGDMMDQVNTIINRVNSLAGRADNYIDKINRAINGFNKVLENPNKLLQPCLFYAKGDGSFGVMGNVRGAGMSGVVKMNGSTSALRLIASSFTAEIFAPAFKKYVAVTNVEGAQNNAAARDFANKGLNMNTVLDGNVRDLVFQVNQKGTYEITYAAVDYSGKMTAKKFYITVK